jgi:Rrf2 family protein
MRLSKRRQYGLKAVVYLAARTENGYVQAREIAQQEALPGKFLESILLALRTAEVLHSKVGVGGGYRLARDPGQIQVAEVLRVLDGTTDESVPPSTPPTVGDQALESLRRELHEALDDAIGNLTLDDLTGRPASGAPS